MDAPADTTRALILTRVRDNLARTQHEARRLRRSTLQFLYLSLVTSAFATILAGLTAAYGPLAGEGPPAWRWTCGIVAVLTGLAGLFTGLYERLGLAESLSQILACTGRLKALEVALTLSNRESGLVARDFEDLVTQFPDLIA